MQEVSILSVNYHNSFELLLNHHLTAALNSESSFSPYWLIADNTFDCDPIKAKKDSHRINIYEGISKKKGLQQSVHHGTALNILREKVSTRFVLVLDPDFYVLSQNWLSLTADFMEKNNLSILGSPWHPLGPRGIKWFDFPNSHFLLIDTKNIDIRDLDFRPAIGEFPEDLTVKSRDVGYRIREKYKDHKQIKYSMLKPTNIPLYLIKKLEILGFPKKSIIHSEYYNSIGLIKALHLRRTQSKLRLSNMSIIEDLLNLFLNTI
jgi:hypothetical protein